MRSIHLSYSRVYRLYHGPRAATAVCADSTRNVDARIVLTLCAQSPTQNTQLKWECSGHLFYPWGFILQILALVHYFRRRGEYYWLFVIFFGGALGALVYIVVEVVPDFGLIGAAFQSHGRKSRIHVVEATIIDNPSVANLEELGELYFDEKQYAQRRAKCFDRAINTRSDSAHSFYRRGFCALELGDPAAAVPDLEVAVRSDPKMGFLSRRNVFSASLRAGRTQR